ncbi:MAG: alanine racemase [Candidatus Dormibacteraeota bacterium]|nr:alanine racemase [Candidatus Dormibacteraeota bacterium]
MTGTKWAEVDATVLRDNTRALRSVSGDGTAVMAMVKANGYGHGAVTAARAALGGGATWLGVSSVTEALELRGAGFDAPILNVGWTTPAEMAAAVAAGVDVTVFDPDGVRSARAGVRAAGRPVRVHWKLDTGMGRLGTRLDELQPMIDALLAARPGVVVAGLFTHFAAADADDLEFTLAQHARFVETTDTLRERFDDVLLHAANSPALLRLPATHHDIVRPGIALYGYPPNPAAGVVLRPAMAVRALVTQVKRMDTGETVGYGREWTAPRPSLVATIAAGYADGVDRRNRNNGVVIVGGALCPVVGRVSMDQFGVDVSAAGAVRSGDVATMIGEADGLSVDATDVALRIGTIAYEVLCAVSARVPRVTVNAEGVIA